MLSSKTMLPAGLLAANLLVAGVATAAEGEVGLSLQFSGLKWSSLDETKTDAAGNEAEETTTVLKTSDLGDALFWVTIDKLNIYFNPFTESSRIFNIGYMFTEALELGLDIAIENSKADESKNETMKNTYGLFATWYQPLGKWNVEASLYLDMINQETKTGATASTAASKVKEDGSNIKVQGVFLYPLAKNAWYQAGLVYQMKNLEGDGEEKTEATQIDVTLAGIRLAI